MKKLLPLLAIPAVSAQSSMTSLFDVIDFHGVYLAAPYFFDMILFIIFFGALAHTILKKRLNAKAAVVIGIILGLSLSLFFYSNSLTIGVFGPLAVGVFLLILAIMLYQLVVAVMGVEDGVKKHRAFAIILTYAIIMSMYLATLPQFFDQLREMGSAGNLLYGLLYGLWGAAVLTSLIWGAIKLFSGKKKGRSSSSSGGGSSTSGSSDFDLKDAVDKLKGMIDNFEQIANSLNARKLAYDGRPLGERVDALRAFYGAMQVDRRKQEIYDLISNIQSQNLDGLDVSDFIDQSNRFYTLVRTIATLRRAMLRP